MNYEDSQIFVEEGEADLRLDHILSKRYSGPSRTYFQWLISEGYVTVNGAIVKKSAKLAAGDEIEIKFIATQELDLEPENIPLSILYEDEHLLAVNKPVGLVVHPGPGNWKGTFVNALLYHCKLHVEEGDLRPGIVHRLDKETSGVLMAAKTKEMHAHLTRSFQERKIKKKYLAICLGKPQNGTIDQPIGRHPTQRKLMTVLEQGGKAARTHIAVLASSGDCSLLEVDLETGRTHQIRVHLKHIGHPLLGDEVYGKVLFGAKRPMLHAQNLTFIHPITRRQLEINAPLAQDICEFLRGHQIESGYTESQ